MWQQTWICEEAVLSWLGIQEWAPISANLQVFESLSERFVRKDALGVRSQKSSRDVATPTSSRIIIRIMAMGQGYNSLAKICLFQIQSDATEITNHSSKPIFTVPLFLVPMYSRSFQSRWEARQEWMSEVEWFVRELVAYPQTKTLWSFPSDPKRERDQAVTFGRAWKCSRNVCLCSKDPDAIQ
jgi:hypothetical protein